MDVMVMVIQVVVLQEENARPYVPRRAALHLRGAERKVPASLLTVLLERPSK
jgi:hypothetical protein